MSSGVPHRWLVLTVRVRPREMEGLAADALVGLGASAVEERDAALVTHLPDPDDPQARLAEVRGRLRALPGVTGVDLSWEWRPHEDWAEIWKRGLGPRRVADGIVVTPTWVEPELRPGERILRIDPGMAFGTAEHATTRGCLRLMAEVAEPGDRILDVGTGTGILAIVAAFLGASEVTALDADPYACQAARENVAANDAEDVVRVMEARAGADELRALGPVGGIVANIQTGVLLDLLAGAYDALGSGGWLVLGGIPEEERRVVGNAASRIGFVLDAEATEDGWWSARFMRGSG